MTRYLVLVLAAFVLAGNGCLSVAVERVNPDAGSSTVATASEVTSTQPGTPTEVPSNATSTPEDGGREIILEPVQTDDVEFLENELRIEAQAEPGAVKLSWTEYSGSSFMKYVLVQSSEDPLPFYPKVRATATFTDRDDFGYTDQNVAPGKTYYYRICALKTETSIACGNVVKVTAE